MPRLDVYIKDEVFELLFRLIDSVIIMRGTRYLTGDAHQAPTQAEEPLFQRCCQLCSLAFDVVDGLR